MIKFNRVNNEYSYVVPSNFNKEQTELLKFAIENYGFLAQNKNISYSDLAQKISNAYSKDNLKNNISIIILDLANTYLEKIEG